ncbi:MAG TPA: alpha/beta hydrolase [Candidatus Babeliales bacterium]|nr:alpha/beta hydrolase [Candidatus Babeliales bacterium]
MMIRLRFFLYCSLYVFFVQGGYSEIPLHQYGITVSTATDFIQNAVAEQVILYAQEREDSHLTIERNGLFIRYPNAVGTIVMCHGFKSDKQERPYLRMIFPRGKYNIMTFDFRAHGEKREGQVCTLGKDEAYDVVAAAQFIKHHAAVKDLPLYVYGVSMGAVAAIEAQAKDPSLFKAMILDCPFDSSDNVVKRGLSTLHISLFGHTFAMPGRALLEKHAFEPRVQLLIQKLLKLSAAYDSGAIQLSVSSFAPMETVKQITIPVFLILCKNDEKVPVPAMMELYTNLACPYKILWITNGSKHFDSYFYSPERYTDMVRSFLDLAETGQLYKEKKSEIIRD